MVVEGFNVNPRSNMACVDEKGLSMKTLGRENLSAKKSRAQESPA
jgi:hypothetical protein